MPDKHSKAIGVLKELKTESDSNNGADFGYYNCCQQRDYNGHKPDCKKIKAIDYFLALAQRCEVLELVKVADKALGYNGLGTKMTPNEINKVFKALVNYLKSED